MLNKKKTILPFMLAAFLLSATGQMEAGFWSSIRNIWKEQNSITRNIVVTAFGAVILSFMLFRKKDKKKQNKIAPNLKKRNLKKQKKENSPKSKIKKQETKNSVDYEKLAQENINVDCSLFDSINTDSSGATGNENQINPEAHFKSNECNFVPIQEINAYDI